MKIKIMPNHANTNVTDVNHESVNRSTPYEYILTAAVSSAYSQNSVVISSKATDRIVKSTTIKTSVLQSKTPKS